MQTEKQNHNKNSFQIIAKSLFIELKKNGYTDSEMINLSSELIELITKGIKEKEKTSN